MVKTNQERVVMGSVVGYVRPTVCRGWLVTQPGKPVVVPGIGGITYNIKLGDPAFGWASDHTEPGVSIYNKDEDESNYLNVLSCIGNEVKVVTGDGKGKRGYVTGTHGGAEDVMVCFEDETLELLCPGDKVLVKAYGQGLELPDYPEIHPQSIDPNLFQALGITENGDGTLTVPAVAEVPPYLMGSGIGGGNPYRSDYDIMTHDVETIRQLGLDKLRFGDLVLLQDCDNVYGRGFLKGACALGVIVHSDCKLAGHGPGVATILSCQKPLLKAAISEDANLKNYMEKVTR